MILPAITREWSYRLHDNDEPFVFTIICKITIGEQVYEEEFSFEAKYQWQLNKELALGIHKIQNKLVGGGLGYTFFSSGVNDEMLKEQAEFLNDLCALCGNRLPMEGSAICRICNDQRKKEDAT